MAVTVRSGDILFNNGSSQTYAFQGTVDWSGVSNRPTALSQFSNNLGNYGGFLDGLVIVGDGVGTIHDISRSGNTLYATKNCNCNCAG